MDKDLLDTITEFYYSYPKRHVKKGTHLLTPSDTDPDTYFIDSGYTRQYATSKNGTEVTIHIYRPKVYIPMTWALGDIPNRHYFEAMTELEIYTAPKADFTSFIHSNPFLLAEFTPRILSALDQLVTRTTQLISYTAEQKVIATLLYLSKYFAKDSEGIIVFTKKFTHEELAKYAGVTRETTSRSLEKLKEESHIGYNKKIFTLKNTAILHSLLD
ncbi:Crp/Fnr family transcriptional regulator [Candidatus Dojkabacteria bacterium]|uniref:Crp/Fnr family transcriptional regulator n=1 Tax=Candidatus Dojkabacteria bacterium TaxID=2099670 RepID=A0A955RK76_9BACT|nr:Crp/Fnr family transcriptional regulator [Candidatus Dojkabacteria bacterium]